MPNFEDTWELANTIAHHFPSFQLEDKLKLLTGRDGRAPAITYHRRKKRVNKKNLEAGPTVDSCPYEVVDPPISSGSTI